jgi:hypothetical protein
MGATVIRLQVLAKPRHVAFAAQLITCEFEPPRRPDNLVGGVAVAADGCFLVAFRELFTVDAKCKLTERAAVAFPACFRDVGAIDRRLRVACFANSVAIAVAVRARWCCEEPVLNERFAMQALKVKVDGVWSRYPKFLGGFWVFMTGAAGLWQVAFEHLGTRVAGGQYEVGPMAAGACCSAFLALVYCLRVDTLLVCVQLLLVAVPAIRFADSFRIAYFGVFR